MKTRDSGMPVEDSWATFFDPERLLLELGLDTCQGAILDVGCGYGTFTLPIARLTGQSVFAIDIEPKLVHEVEERARSAALTNVRGIVRDVAVDGIGQPDGSAALVLLFNLLHCEDPIHLIRDARRALTVGGRLAAIHWRSDIVTPRGPDLSIRPRPEIIHGWLLENGFALEVPPRILPPFHFGMVGIKT